jgi:hypothetical protein
MAKLFRNIVWDCIEQEEHIIEEQEAEEEEIQELAEYLTEEVTLNSIYSYANCRCTEDTATLHFISVLKCRHAYIFFFFSFFG